MSVYTYNRANLTMIFALDNTFLDWNDVAICLGAKYILYELFPKALNWK